MSRSKLNHVAFLTSLAISVLAFARGGGPGPGARGPGQMPPPDFGQFNGFAGFGNPFGGPTVDPAALQKQIAATNEEWIVIWPKLQRIIRLRDEVDAALDPSTGGGFNMGMFGGMGGFSMGGSGLEAPDNLGMSAPPSTAPGGAPPGGFGGMPNMANQADPFNPQKVPGIPQPAAPAFGGFGGPGGGFGGPPPGGGGMFTAGQGNAVLSLLTELRTMLANKDTTETQMKDKLIIIRAARQKSAANLQAAQNDLLQLLTSQQQAALVASGYLD